MPRDKTIYDVLEQEHRLVSQLLERAQAAEPAEREDLFAEITDQLVSHSEAESETFYAALRDHEETRELVEEAESEHQAVTELLDQIDHTGDESAVADQMRQLAEMVQHHVEEEESEIFARARSVLEDDEARELARRFQSLKQAVVEEEMTPEDVVEED